MLMRILKKCGFFGKSAKSMENNVVQNHIKCVDSGITIKRGTMKRAILILISIAGLNSCENAIEQAQDFKPNNRPVFGTATVERFDGVPIDTQNILNDTTFKLDIEVKDPEGQRLTIDLVSDYGSFSGFETTDTGCSVLFITNRVKGNTPVTVRVTAADTKRGVATDEITVGIGKAPPKPLVTPSTLTVSNAGYGVICVSADCTGEFQLVRGSAADDPADIHIDTLKPASLYNAGDAARTVSICGRNLVSVPSGKIFRLSAGSGVERIWVVFVDLLGQEKAEPVDVTVTP